MPSIYLLAMSSFVSLLVGSLVILFTNSIIPTTDDRRAVFSLFLACRKAKITHPVVGTVAVNMVDSRFITRILQERISYKAMYTV